MCLDHNEILSDMEGFGFSKDRNSLSQIHVWCREGFIRYCPKTNPGTNPKDKPQGVPQIVA